jgi:hypothetical protein
LIIVYFNQMDVYICVTKANNMTHQVVVIKKEGYKVLNTVTNKRLLKFKQWDTLNIMQ